MTIENSITEIGIPQRIAIASNWRELIGISSTNVKIAVNKRDRKCTVEIKAKPYSGALDRETPEDYKSLTTFEQDSESPEAVLRELLRDYKIGTGTYARTVSVQSTNSEGELYLLEDVCNHVETKLVMESANVLDILANLSKLDPKMVDVSKQPDL